MGVAADARSVSQRLSYDMAGRWALYARYGRQIIRPRGNQEVFPKGADILPDRQVASEWFCLPRDSTPSSAGARSVRQEPRGILNREGATDSLKAKVWCSEGVSGAGLTV